MKKRYLYLPILIAALFIVADWLSSIDTAVAHMGHEGPSKVFMKESEAVRTMLPQEGIILKRKEILKKEQYAEVIKKWGYSPEEGIYTYYISKGANGNLLGALFIQLIEYKHGNVTVAISYNNSGHISDIRILSCSEKYVIEVREALLDSGYLDTFLHNGIDEIISASEDYDKDKKDTILYLTEEEIKKTAMLLRLFHGL